MFKRVPSSARFSTLRCYSTHEQPRPSIKLIGELRKLTDVSITKAREALAATGNNVDSALQWLQTDLVTSGAQKAAKVKNREAREGLISISVLGKGFGSRNHPYSKGVRAAMIELNCETDFVARNELFGRLAADIAHTAASVAQPAGSDLLLASPCMDALNDAQLLSANDPNAQGSSATVHSSIRDAIAKMGENISLRRAVTVVQPSGTGDHTDPGLRVASHLHGTLGIPSQGRIGALAILQIKSPHLERLVESHPFLEDLERLERSIARQIVGFETRGIFSSSGDGDGDALYDQPFMMLAGGSSNKSVKIVLQEWALERLLEKDGLEVLEFTKWAVGESE